MTNEEFENILEGQAETQRIEFKTACSWSVRCLAKDILALSNVRDGGFIIIGVEDETFERVGVDSEVKDSYNIDIMRDQMARFADPHVDFSVEFLNDKDDLEFVLITVRQFRDIPIICSRNDQNADVYEGKIYYRNLNRRAESAPISNSYDMRDLIELAVVKMMQRKKELGFQVEDSTAQSLDNELGGL